MGSYVMPRFSAELSRLLQIVRIYGALVSLWLLSGCEREPALVLQPAVVDFGTITKLNWSGSKPVSLRNSSDHAVTIERAESTCGCLRLEVAPKTTLDPKGSIEVRVVADFRGRPPKQAREDLVLILAGSGDVIRVPVQYVYHPDVILTKQEFIVAGSIASPEQLSDSAYILNLGERELVATPSQAMDGRLTCELSPFERDDFSGNHRRGLKVTVSLLPTARVASDFDANVELLTNSQVNPILRLPVRVRVDGLVNAVPTLVVFRDVEPGVEYVRHVRLSGISGGVPRSGPMIEIDNASLAIRTENEGPDWIELEIRLVGPAAHDSLQIQAAIQISFAGPVPSGVTIPALIQFKEQVDDR